MKVETRLVLELNELVFYTQGLVGYIAKIEYQMPEKMFISKANKLSHKFRPTSFQFKMDPENRLFYGTFSDEPISEIRSALALESTNRYENIISMSNENRGSHNLSGRLEIGTTTREKLNIYGEGIKTLRLFNNKVMHLEEFMTDEDENDEEEKNQQSIFQNQSDDDDEEENEGVFNMSRNEVNYVLNHQKKHKILRILQILVNFTFLQSFFFAYLVFFQNFTHNDQTNHQMMLLKSSYSKSKNFQQILLSLNELYFLNKGIYDAYNLTEIDVKKNIENTLNDLKSTNLYLTQNSNDVSSELSNLLVENVIPIYFSSQQIQKFSLNQATDQMISKALNLLSSSLDSFQLGNLNFNFFILNIYGNFQASLSESNSLYYKNLKDDLALGEVIVIALLVSGILFGVVALIFIYISRKIEKINHYILGLFLLIKEKDLRKIIIRNEAFLSYLQTGDDEEDDLENNEDDEAENKEITHEEYQIKKKRKFKKGSKTPYKLIAFLILMAMCLEFFFFFVYFYANSVNTQLLELSDFFESSNKAEFDYLFAYNCQQSLMINENSFVNGLKEKCNKSLNDIQNFESTYFQVIYFFNPNIFLIFRNFLKTLLFFQALF